MNTQQYYAQIRQTRDKLAEQNPEGFCLVISVLNLEKNSTPGNLCEVNLKDAARLITDTTHRLATAEESSAHRARQAHERHSIAQENLNRARAQFSNIMGVEAASLPVPPLPVPPGKTGK